jgi:hypothetical protein
MKFKYIHIKNNNSKLLVYFNDMTQVGFSDHFSLFKQLNSIFSDFDILFIKDIAEYYWYLTIIDDILALINELNCEYKYKDIYGFAGSSGSMGLLNTLPKIANFRKGVIINGQVSLKKEDVDQYRGCKDCYVFTEEKIKESYHQDYLTPFTYIEKNHSTYKLLFYHNCSHSDSVNHQILKNNYPLRNMTYIDEGNKHGPFHGPYLIKKYSNESLESYKHYFLS